jgi:hypothetical protein
MMTAAAYNLADKKRKNPFYFSVKATNHELKTYQHSLFSRHCLGKNFFNLSEMSGFVTADEREPFVR